MNSVDGGVNNLAEVQPCRILWYSMHKTIALIKTGYSKQRDYNTPYNKNKQPDRDPNDTDLLDYWHGPLPASSWMGIEPGDVRNVCDVFFIFLEI